MKPQIRPKSGRPSRCETVKLPRPGADASRVRKRLLKSVLSTTTGHVKWEDEEKELGSEAAELDEGNPLDWAAVTAPVVRTSGSAKTREEAIEAGNRAAAMFDFWMLSRAKREISKGKQMAQPGAQASGHYERSPPRSRGVSANPSSKKDIMDQFWQLQYGDKCPYNDDIFTQATKSPKEKEKARRQAAGQGGISLPAVYPKPQQQSPYLELPPGAALLQARSQGAGGHKARGSEGKRLRQHQHKHQIQQPYVAPHGRQSVEDLGESLTSLTHVDSEAEMQGAGSSVAMSGTVGWDLFGGVGKPLPLPGTREGRAAVQSQFGSSETAQAEETLPPDTRRRRPDSSSNRTPTRSRSPPGRSQSPSPERPWEPPSASKPIIKEQTYNRYLVRSHKSPPRAEQVASLGILRWPQARQLVGPWHNQLAAPRPHTPGVERLPPSRVQEGFGSGLGPRARKAEQEYEQRRPFSAPQPTSTPKQLQREDEMVLSLRAALMLASTTGQPSPSTFLTTHYRPLPQVQTQTATLSDLSGPWTLGASAGTGAGAARPSSGPATTSSNAQALQPSSIVRPATATPSLSSSAQHHYHDEQQQQQQQQLKAPAPAPAPAIRPSSSNAASSSMNFSSVSTAMNQPTPSSLPTSAPFPSSFPLGRPTTADPASVAREMERKNREEAEVAERQRRLKNLESKRDGLRERLDQLERRARLGEGESESGPAGALTISETARGTVQSSEPETTQLQQEAATITSVTSTDRTITAPVPAPASAPAPAPASAPASATASATASESKSSPKRADLMLALQGARPLRKTQQPSSELTPQVQSEKQRESDDKQRREELWGSYTESVRALSAVHETAGGAALIHTLPELGVAYPWGRLLGRGKFSANYVAYCPPPVDAPEGSQAFQQVCLKIAQFQHNDPLMKAASNSRPPSGSAGEGAGSTSVLRPRIAPTNRRSAPPPAIQNEFLREVRAMSACRHPCIVELLAVLVPPSPIGLVLELMPGGSLADALQHPLWANVSQQQKLGLAKGIIRGLAKMHSLRYLHRDLKPHNVLLGPRVLPTILEEATGLRRTPSGSWLPVEDDTPRSVDSKSPRPTPPSSRRENPLALAAAASVQLGWVLDAQSLQGETNEAYALTSNWVVAKVADLGTAVELTPDEITEAGMQPGTVTGVVGTTGYVAPEVLREDSYGKAVDVFSLAIVLYELFNDVLPAPNLLVGATGAHFPEERPSLGAGHPPLVSVICKKSWDLDPAKRPTTAALCGVLKITLDD